VSRQALGDLRRTRPPLAGQGPAVVEVQRALAANGFDPGPADGFLGPKARAALDAFRQRRGLGETAPEGDVLDALLGGPAWRTSAAALSPRGDFFAVADNNGIIRITDLPQADYYIPASAWPVFMIHGQVGPVLHLAISTDGRQLASVGVDGRVWLTDVEGARRRSRLPFYNLRTGPMPREVKPVPLEDPAPSASAPSSAPGLASAAAQPQRNVQSTAPVRENDLIVVFGADRTLADARKEVARAATAGFSDAEIVFREGWYRSVARFATAEAQARGLAELRALSLSSQNAYARSLSAWCPNPQRDDGFMRCQASVQQQQQQQQQPRGPAGR
jgi:peptidoglycan hydrolase-like protein with peptidoglycan-binding domain